MSSRILTLEEREWAIHRAIWSFGLSGIPLTREEAEQALDEALSKSPLEI